MKTKPTSSSVAAFLAKIPDPARRRDCKTLAAMMQRITGERPILWSTSIVGFGKYHYKYDTGREGEWFPVGFSPRKNDLTIYILAGLERYPDLLRRLGTCKTGRSCLYLKSLAGVDLKVLEQLVARGVRDIARDR